RARAPPRPGRHAGRHRHAPERRRRAGSRLDRAAARAPCPRPPPRDRRLARRARPRARASLPDARRLRRARPGAHRAAALRDAPRPRLAPRPPRADAVRGRLAGSGVSTRAGAAGGRLPSGRARGRGGGSWPLALLRASRPLERACGGVPGRPLSRPDLHDRETSLPRVLLVQACEESDPVGRFVPRREREAATEAARAESPAPPEAWVAGRARRLAETLEGRHLALRAARRAAR